MLAVATAKSERVAFRQIPRTAFVAFAVAIIINLILWFGGVVLTGGQVKGIAWPSIIVANAVLLVLGGGVLAILDRLSKRPFTLFDVVACLFLALFALNPISAMSTSLPGTDGPLNLTTVVVLELEHLVAGAAAIWAFNTYARI